MFFFSFLRISLQLGRKTRATFTKKTAMSLLPAFTTLHPRIFSAFFPNIVALGPSAKICEKSDTPRLTSWPGFLLGEVASQFTPFLTNAPWNYRRRLEIYDGGPTRVKIDFIYLWRAGGKSSSTPPRLLSPSPPLPYSSFPPYFHQMHPKHFYWSLCFIYPSDIYLSIYLLT